MRSKFNYLNVSQIIYNSLVLVKKILCVLGVKIDVREIEDVTSD